MITLFEIYFNGGYQTRRVATDFFYSKATDSIGVVEFEGRVIGKPSFDVKAGCVIWKNKSSVSIGDIEIANTDGWASDWATFDFRDSRCVIRLVEENGSYDSSTVVETCIVDDVERSENTVIVRLRGVDTLLDRPIQPVLYDSVTGAENVSIIGYQVPIVIGKILQAEPVNIDINDLVFQVSDSIVQIDEVYSGGSIANPPIESPDDYAVSDTGFTMLNNPSARLTFDATTSHRVLVLSESDFYLESAWTGSSPNGWSVTLGPGSVSKVSGVGLRMVNALSAEYPVIESSGSGASWYMVIGELADITSGGIEVDFGTGTPYQVRKQGRFSCVGRTDTGDRIAIRGLADSDVTLRFVYVYEFFASTSTTIFRAIQNIAARCGLRVQGANADLVAPALGGRNVGVYVKDGESGQEVLDKILDSVAGYRYPDRFGVIRFGQFARPSGTPAIRISRVNMQSKPRRVTDLMPGLSTKVAGGRNQSPYGESELAGITFPNRPPFMQDFKYVREGALSKSINAAYTQALSAPYIETAIADEAGTQAEADRIVEIAQDAQPFWEMTLLLSAVDDIDSISIDTIVLLDDPYFEESNGMIAKIVGKAGSYGDLTMKILTWGSESA